jgi:hypothetical protein
MITNLKGAANGPLAKMLAGLPDAREHDGGWRAKCPAHDDDRPSLSVREGDDGRALIHCHAGCTVEAVVEALGLRMSDLFNKGSANSSNPGSNGSANGDNTNANSDSARTTKKKKRKKGRAFSGRQFALSFLDRLLKKEGYARTKTFYYHDQAGDIAAAVARFERVALAGAPVDKTFRPIHKEGQRWFIGDPPGPWPLYRLGDLGEAQRVYVCEGEKAADTVRALGLAATTSAHGAKSAGKTDWTPLRGKEVVLVPDFDEAGAGYAVEVAGILLNLGCGVKVIDLGFPGRVAGADAFDWDAHWKAEGKDKAGRVAELERLTAAAKVIEKAEEVGAQLGRPKAAAEAFPIPEPAAWPDPPAAEAFHGLPGRIVRLIEPASEADPAALLAQTLVMFGSVVGRGPYFLVEADRHHANEYLILTGRTSKARKGTSWGRVYGLFHAVDEAWAKNCQQTGLSSGEGLIWAVRDPGVVQEGTEDGGGGKQKRAKVDPGVTDKRLLVFEAEFASVLRQTERSGNTLSTIVRAAWDRGDLQSLTKNSPARATGAHVSMVGHVTAHEFRRLLTQSSIANGFGNRFLICCCRRSKLLPNGGKVDGTAWAELRTELTEAVNFARGVGLVTRDAQADALWNAVYPALSEGGIGLAADMAGRAEAHVTRLALLYALMDRSAVVRLEHLEAALALWVYADRSIKYVFGNHLGDSTADAILQLLKGAPGGLTRTDISNAFGRNLSVGHLTRALGLLLEQRLVRLVRRVTEPSGGRPVERWFATEE